MKSKGRWSGELTFTNRITDRSFAQLVNWPWTGVSDQKKFKMDDSDITKYDDVTF